MARINRWINEDGKAVLRLGHSWCSGPEAVIDPMHTQMTDFEYYPVELMYQRLDDIGRSDQRKELEKRLSSGRKRFPTSVLPDKRF